MISNIPSLDRANMSIGLLICAAETVAEVLWDARPDDTISQIVSAAAYTVVFTECQKYNLEINSDSARIYAEVVDQLFKFLKAKRAKSAHQPIIRHRAPHPAVYDRMEEKYYLSEGQQNLPLA